MSLPDVQELPRVPGSSGSRMLFVRLRSLGDVVLMTPLLAVVKRVRGWRVGVVVEAPYQQLLENNPNVDELFVVRYDSRRWLARLRIIRQLRAFRAEVAVDLHGGSTSALMTLFSGAPQRVGYRSGRQAFLYNLRVPDSRQVWQRAHVHTVEHQLSILKHLGFPVEPIPAPEIRIRKEDTEAVKKRLLELGVDAAQWGAFVLIHPGAALETKQWARDKFAGLARRLAAQGRQVVFTAGPGQQSLLQAIRTGCPPQVRFVEPLPLSRFAALAALCGLYVGNDTGSTHLAAALKRKIVAIFGSSDFRIWHPWGVEHRLLHADLPCIPCPGYFCLHYDEPRCIRSIEIEPVFKAVQALL